MKKRGIYYQNVCPSLLLSVSLYVRVNKHFIFMVCYNRDVSAQICERASQPGEAFVREGTLS